MLAGNQEVVRIQNLEDDLEDVEVLNFYKGATLPETQNFNDGDYVIVGHGQQTNEKCGTWGSYFGCVRKELHNRISVHGVNYTGKAFVFRVKKHCDKPSCPVCFAEGWAVKQARREEKRLKLFARHFGQVEHLTASVPVKHYGLDYDGLREKAIEALGKRGVVGGFLIFHAYRRVHYGHWYFSPHFHVLGFIAGGYKCRGCDCLRFTYRGVAYCGNADFCDGFEQLTRRLNKADGFILRVFGKRITVGGTLWYQLNHATLRKSVKRPHVGVWFGVCSTRRKVFTPEERKELVYDEPKFKVCPICGHEVVKLQYVGDKFFDAKDLKNGFFPDLCEDGIDVWIEVPPDDVGYKRRY
jgi:hypothetical protein